MYKLEEGKLIQAPSKIHKFEEDREIFIVNPSEDLLKELGYKHLIEEERPDINENQYLEPYYEENEDNILCKWEIKESEGEDVADVCLA